MNSTEENIKVIVRIKPNIDKERVFLTHNLATNSIIVPGRDEYIFDKVGDANITQEEIFENCRNLFQSFVDGYNATIFAYGQTGSGKTFTMTGDSDESGNTVNPGLIPRGLSYIFDKVNERALTSGIEYLIKCSFVEIYNEQIYDLLDHQQQRLHLRFNISQEVYLEQCTEIIMDNPRDANKILKQGLLNRHIASTEMNRESSRSHAVFLIVLESRESQGEIDNIKKSCLYLVDLAGSERQRDSKAVSIRLKEAGMINKSLLALSLVIRKLVESSKGNKPPYIAYRDSKLTLLLKDALGGNSKTALVACLHNDIRFMPDTYSTIQFASSVKMIRNKAKINVNISGDNETLRKEICFLNEQLAKYKSPQIIQCHEFDYDLVWKKRFITAMALRSCLSLDVSSLNNQMAQINNMNLRFQKTNDSLRMEREIKDKKLKYLEENSEENFGDNDFKQFLKSTLDKLNENILIIDEQIKSDQLQIQVNYLTDELAKSRILNLLAVSDQTLIHSLLKDYNNIIESGTIETLLVKTEGRDIEMINLQQELSQTRYKNSLLKKKINDNDIIRRNERRKLETEIASIKSNLKIVDEQRECAVGDRRRTLLSISDLHTRPFSPIKNVSSINCRRRTKKPKEVILEEDEDNLQPLNEWLKQNDQDKINELEAALRLKETEIGSMEYSINDYKKEIEYLKNMLFSKEILQNNLKDIEAKYVSTNMALEVSQETIKKLNKENSSLDASKNIIIQKLTEQKYNLNDEILANEKELEICKNDLESKNIMIVCLNDDINRINVLLQTSLSECCSKDDEIESLKLKLLSSNEELDYVKEELSTAQVSLKISEDLKRNYNEQVIANSKKIEELEKSKIEKVYEATFKQQENEYLITQLSDEIKMLKEEIEENNKENKRDNSLRHVNQSSKQVLLQSPQCCSSPINIKHREDSLRELRCDLMSSMTEVEEKYKLELKKIEEITNIIEKIFNDFRLTLGDSLVDNITKIQAKIVSYRHDYEDLVIKKMELEERLKHKDEYCNTLSEGIETSRLQRDIMKKELDELIDVLPSGGHANHRQKIEYFTKYKEGNARLKQENLKLVDDNTAMKLWLTEKQYLDLFEAYYAAYKKKRYNSFIR